MSGAVKRAVVVALIAGLGSVAGSWAVAGQASSLDTAQAKSFIGDWVLTLEGRRGPQEQALSIKDVGGKVAATLSGGRAGDASITDITKSGENLVLKFERSFQGNSMGIALTLMPQADGTLKVTQETGGGQFSSTGTGKKK